MLNSDKSYSSFKTTKFGAKFEDFQKSREWNTYQRLGDWQSIFLIFKGNFDELKKLLVELESDQSKKTFNKVLLNSEVLRLLHNFLSAAGALINNGRRPFKELYLDHQTDGLYGEFAKEYKEKINLTFAENKLNLFVKDLRNYFLHETLPLLELKSEGSGLVIYLDVLAIVKSSHFTEGNYWSRYSKSYINSVKENIYLLALIDEYYSLINEFHAWRESRQDKIHKIDFEVLEVKQRELLE